MTALSVDLGTTALKAVLSDEAGVSIASASEHYTTFGEREGFAEQDPNSWWDALCSTCASLQKQQPELFRKLEFVIFCGQMHTHVYLNAEGRPLRSAITWMDQRASEIAAEYASSGSTASVIKQEAANAPTPTYTAPNIVWVSRHEPSLFEKTKSVLIAKDYLKYLLTGVMSTDYSEAAGTMLFHVSEKRWSKPLLELFHVDASLLPEVMPAAEVMGTVTKTASAATGIPFGVPVINGATDNSTAALGAGVTESGEATLIIGTAGVVSVCSDQPKPNVNDAVACWNYALDDRWISIGVMQTAGESLNWFRRAFDEDQRKSTDDIFSMYNGLVEEIPDGSEGLFFLPYLNGERSPYWDADARGVFFGAGLGTKKGHFVKAVMEGVAMALRSNAEVVESLGQPIDEVRAIGGGLQSRPWLAVLSKVLEKPILITQGIDASVRGNIAIGRTALGSLSHPRELVKSDEHTQRIAPPNSRAYDAHYQIFLELYQKLYPVFKKRAELYAK